MPRRGFLLGACGVARAATECAPSPPAPPLRCHDRSHALEIEELVAGKVASMIRMGGLPGDRLAFSGDRVARRLRLRQRAAPDHGAANSNAQGWRLEARGRR